MAGSNPGISRLSLVGAVGSTVRLLVPCLIAVLIVVTLAFVPKAVAGGGATYIPDCNDPDANDLLCLEPNQARIQQLHNEGYPYYIGHAEPTAEFFSTVGTSGNNMKWKFVLPSDPASAPTQNGSIVDNFELYLALWQGLALCDPNSNPFGSCVPDSDSNNPATAGAAFLELQFYPPGFEGVSTTQWSVNLHINTAQTPLACEEPTTAAFVTTNGVVAGPKLLMNSGDTIVVTLHDTASGLEADVDDVTTSTTGFMVASGANGFKHNANQTDCTTAAFDFHPLYQTASPGQGVPWAEITPNVAFNFEIGHFELCGDAACSTLPDGGDADDNHCGTTNGIGGCTGSDVDHDGTPYLADWADGTSSHPSSVVIGNSNDNGVGPLSTPLSNLADYRQPYNLIRFVSSENTNGSFYPFFSQSGTGSSCRFNFGNDLPSTLNNFGQRSQFGPGAGTGTVIANPCGPASFVLNSEKVELARSMTATNADQVDMALTFTDDGIGGSCDSGNNALTSGVMASLFAGSCLDFMGSGLSLDLDPFTVHTAGSQSWGTLSQMSPTVPAPETVLARIVTEPKPGGSCGKWNLDIEVAGLDLMTLGLNTGNPYALLLTDADAAFGCFDIRNAVVGVQTDPPKVRRGARR